MSQSIEFQLLAPYNRAAQLIGSFSDWDAIPMEKDAKGYFRASVDLEDGTYQYKFRVQSKSPSYQPDEWVEVNDPCVTEIDRDSQNGVIHIKDGKKVVDDYVWQHDDIPLPQNDELIIYELLISDFFKNGNKETLGTYKTALEKLDYLQDLGINTIELLPVNETPGSYNWGYTPSYFFAPNPAYGTPKDLKHFIDECHGRGMRVILDQLYNHSSDDSPLLAIDREYWYYAGRHHPNDEANYWGPEFNYEKYDDNRETFPAREFMGNVVRFWVQEYHIDGIRYDALKQLDNWDFLRSATQLAQDAAGPKPFYNIGERIPDDPSITSPTGPMEGCWHDSFYYIVGKHLCNGLFDLKQMKEAIAPQQQGYPDGITKAVVYLGDHDHSHLIRDLGDHGIFGDAAFGRLKLGAVLLMTAGGVPMLWMGDEFGDSTDINASQTDQQVDWSLLSNDRNQDLLQYYKSLIYLHKHNAALHTSKVDFFHENPDQRVFAYGRWNEEGSRVVVVANFSDTFLKDYTIPEFPANGTWHEWTRNYAVESKNNELVVDLGGYEAQVFVWS